MEAPSSQTSPPQSENFHEGHTAQANQGFADLGQPSKQQGDEVIIRGDRVLPTLIPSPIQVEKIQKDFTAEKQKLLNRITESRNAILQAQRDLQDHELMIQRNRDTINAARSSTQELLRQEQEKEQAKRLAMEEERRLEEQRAQKHSQAVAAENERAEIKARRVAAEQAELHANALIQQHQQAISHTNNLINAHNMAISALEAQTKALEQQVEIMVMGQRAIVSEQEARIHVQVKPEFIPEARCVPTEAQSIRQAAAAIQEHAPPVQPVVLEQAKKAETSKAIQKERVVLEE